jgi:hypothetical protein
MKPSCITAPYRWPSPPGKTCPRRGPASMSRRGRWGSTQLTTGSVGSGLAALSPLAAVTRDLRLSPVQKFLRCVDKPCSGLPNVSGRFARPSSAVDLSRRHFAGRNGVPMALGVGAVKPPVVGPWLFARRPGVKRPRPRRSAVSDAFGLLTWRTPRSCLVNS